MDGASGQGQDVRSVTDGEFDRLLAVARRLASTSDLDGVLGVIIDALRDLLRADRASVFQFSAERGEMYATRAHGLPTSMRLPADRGLVGEAATSRHIINVVDAHNDERFDPAVDRETGYRTRSILTIPMVDFEGELVGVAQVLNKMGDGGTFSAQDEAIARYLADQAGVALKRATLLEARRTRDKLEADLDLARAIQQAALPTGLPALVGYDLACHFEPAEQTGGDVWDVIQSPQDAGRALVFLADATGHGVGPALSAVQALAMVRMGVRLGADVPTLAHQINDQLLVDLPVGRFVTAFIGELDTHQHTLSYICAGQAPLLVVRCAGDVERLGSTVMPLGIEPAPDLHRPERITLESGDVFALLSDGFYEALNTAQALFGVDRVVDVVLGNRGESADEIMDALVKAVGDHTGRAGVSDDRTGIILKRTE